ncbi:efflux RND transporter periplasmic adaptor subunit [bacterium]|nr:efflux RND transporter periplasmic adaptor subunit [bacterium]
MGNACSVGRAALMLVVLVVAGCGHRSGDEQFEAGPAVTVQTVTVTLQDAPETVEVVGTVRAKVSASVAAKVMAVVEAVRVRAGDTVEAGAELAVLDSRELRAEFERAQADFKRYQALLERQAATRAEFDAVEARFRVAEAVLSHTRLVAPFAGRITGQQCDPGDLATPGRALFTIEQPGAFRLEAAVPERFRGAVAVGQQLEVRLGASAAACTGVVGEIVPAADPDSRSFLVKIDLECPGPLTSGVFGRAWLPVGQRPLLAVPRTAVRERGQLTYVYVAEEDRARLRLIKTGKAAGEAVEVLAGLEPGAQVIVGHDGELTDGGRIGQ